MVRSGEGLPATKEKVGVVRAERIRLVPARQPSGQVRRGIPGTHEVGVYMSRIYPWQVVPHRCILSMTVA